MIFNAVGGCDSSNSGGLQMDLLWTNAKPTSKFAAQTVSIDLSGYAAIVVTSREYCGRNNQHATFIPVDNTAYWIHQGFVEAGTPIEMHSRKVTASATGCTFGAGYDQGVEYGESSNEAAVPVKIYGIKGSVT